MGCFITFEGIEGCGKTTQIRLLAENLQSLGHNTLLTREPGGCPIADKIRAILLDAENSAMTPKTELLLYAAARSQHVAEIVVPALKADRIVLCDRFTDATIAYQGDGRGVALKEIAILNEMATEGIAPDITVLLDCPVEIGISRAVARIEANSRANAAALREERFERESLEFHQRVRDGYLTLAAKAPDRFIVVDGSMEVSKCAATIFAAVQARQSRS
jgi:dTMP kinase